MVLCLSVAGLVLFFFLLYLVTDTNKVEAARKANAVKTPLQQRITEVMTGAGLFCMRQDDPLYWATLTENCQWYAHHPYRDAYIGIESKSHKLAKGIEFENREEVLYIFGVDIASKEISEELLKVAFEVLNEIEANLEKDIAERVAWCEQSKRVDAARQQQAKKRESESALLRV